MISQVIYGSCARKDNDILSDKDIGIICEEPDLTFDCVTMFAANGWSCAVYSYERFKQMADLGLLFIQHIKQDGIIIRDDDYKLRSILSNFYPKKKYSKEINDAIQLLSVTQKITLDATCIFWALDIISIAVRNFSIAYYANKSNFVFSTNILFKMLAKDFNLSSAESEALTHLRNAKYKYRHNLYEHNELENGLCLIYTFLSIFKKMKINYEFEVVCRESFMHSVMNMMDENMPAYYRLRLVEILYNMNKKKFSETTKRKFYNIINSPHVDPYTLPSHYYCNDMFKFILQELADAE